MAQFVALITMWDMNMKLKQYIGARVREARLQSRMSQEQLAAAIDKSVETVSNVETGRKLTNIDTLYIICSALGKPIAFLFEGYEDARKVKRARMDKEADAVRLLQQLRDSDLDTATALLKAYLKHSAA
jgi:transcriptional regulator with XRE-family HTH domain